MICALVLHSWSSSIELVTGLLMVHRIVCASVNHWKEYVHRFICLANSSRRSLRAAKDARRLGCIVHVRMYWSIDPAMGRYFRLSMYGLTTMANRDRFVVGGLPEKLTIVDISSSYLEKGRFKQNLYIFEPGKNNRNVICGYLKKKAHQVRRSVTHVG